MKTSQQIVEKMYHGTQAVRAIVATQPSLDNLVAELSLDAFTIRHNLGKVKYEELLNTQLAVSNLIYHFEVWKPCIAGGPLILETLKETDKVLKKLLEV